MSDARSINDARYTLNRGMRFPFDAPDSWWEDGDAAPPPSTDWAHAAARGVVADLSDRRGVKQGFDGIDEDTRADLVAALAAIIRLAESDRS